jgi:hypothetical protein
MSNRIGIDLGGTKPQSPPQTFADVQDLPVEQVKLAREKKAKQAPLPFAGRK